MRRDNRQSGFARTALTIVMLASVAWTASCGLPRPGPNKKEIFAGSALKGGDAFVVSVTPRVNRLTAVVPASGFSQRFLNAGVLGSDQLANGDVLSITVYENVRDDPLLGNTGQRVSALTEVQVDGQGYIFIPYAGRLKAAGSSVEALRRTITRKLDSQTPDPQVQVARKAGDGSTVTLSGAVSSPGTYPIEQDTRTLTSMLAAAGDVRIEPETALVRVTRGRETGKVWLEDLWSTPSFDIALRAGDKIVVEEDRRKFTSLGATGQQNLVNFKTTNLSALEAIASVGGLQTATADPTGVFVFRNEAPEIANPVLGRTDLVGSQRMIYLLDLTAPNGIFEARDFLIRDGDTVYVTEAPYVQWQKTLSAITGSAGAAANLSDVANNN